MHTDEKITRIRKLNDELRCMARGGSIMLTRGVAALGEAAANEVLAEVASFRDFTEDNDPHGEHDFGSFELAGEKIFWKIDYYDLELTYGSPDPADPTVTARVMTVMLAEEY